MNILVTGGLGFIGSSVVDEYVREGHKVYVLDNLYSGSFKNRNSKAIIKKGDVRNRRNLQKLFKNDKIHVINHHAAQIDVRKSVENPFFDAEVNVFGLLNLLELGREKKIKKFIFSASGGTAYGECSRPAKEGDPEVPLSPYGVTKLAGEKYIQTFGALYGMRFTIFRYANVYGPRQDPHGEAGVVAIFSQNLLSQRPIFIYGTGRQSRDFVFVGDVARANGLAINRGHNQIFNIGTGKETNVNQLYQVMSKILKVNQKPKYKKARPGELQRSVLHIRRAQAELGWKPQIFLKAGLIRTIQYFQNYKGNRR